MDLWIVDALFQTGNTITLRSRAKNLRTLWTFLHLIHSSAAYAASSPFCTPLNPMHSSASKSHPITVLYYTCHERLPSTVWTLLDPLYSTAPHTPLCTPLHTERLLAAPPHPMYPSASPCTLYILLCKKAYDDSILVLQNNF